MVFVCGIDEAGRGPVIGPMVMAGVLVEEKDLDKLKSIGAKDSKLLTKKEREELFPKIIKIVKKYKIVIIHPKEIDDALFSDDLNLNWLEAHKAAEIINEIKPDKVIIDSPSNNCDAYTRYTKKLIKDDKIEVLCTHKADVKYVEVSAASILAKVTRDNEMEKIQQKYGNTGPGYTSNAITQKFLKENWEKHPEIFRHSWVSYKNHKEAKFQKTLTDFGKFLEEKKEKDVIAGKITKEALEELEEYGYEFKPTKSEHEIARLQGPATIILYKSGKLLIQGKNREMVRKILQERGFNI